MNISQEKKEKYKYFKCRKFRELIKFEFKNPVSIFNYSNSFNCRRISIEFVMEDINLVTIVFSRFHSLNFISLIRNKREKHSLEMLIFLFTIRNTLMDGHSILIYFLHI